MNPYDFMGPPPRGHPPYPPPYRMPPGPPNQVRFVHRVLEVALQVCSSTPQCMSQTCETYFFYPYVIIPHRVVCSHSQKS